MQGFPAFTAVGGIDPSWHGDLERLAREKFHMQRPTEDVFVLQRYGPLRRAREENSSEACTINPYELIWQKAKNGLCRPRKTQASGNTAIRLCFLYAFACGAPFAVD